MKNNKVGSTVLDKNPASDPICLWFYVVFSLRILSNHCSLLKFRWFHFKQLPGNWRLMNTVK